MCHCMCAFIDRDARFECCRGHSFTRALLGLPARELHVCGCPSAVPLLRRLVSETGASATGPHLVLALTHLGLCLPVCFHASAGGVLDSYGCNCMGICRDISLCLLAVMFNCQQAYCVLPGAVLESPASKRDASVMLHQGIAWNCVSTAGWRRSRPGGARWATWHACNAATASSPSRAVRCLSSSRATLRVAKQSRR